MAMSIPASIAWYRKTACIASRTGLLPLNEKETFDRPPLVRAPGQRAFTSLTASMKLTA